MKKYIVAKNYLCFLALLEMILIDITGYENLPLTQTQLAEYFGITIPYDEKSFIHNCRRSNDLSEIGVYINEDILNIFFHNIGIPIDVKYIKESPYEYSIIDEYQNSHLRENSYIVYTYSYGDLYKDIGYYDLGHVALLESVLSVKEIEIYDPGPKNPGKKIVKREDMHEAMLARKAGMYIFRVNYSML